MQTEDIDREIAATMANTPREPDESKQAYQVRARQLTYERLDKAKPASASIKQARVCFLCHKPMGDKPGQVVDIGGGLNLVAHPACYERLASAGDIKPAVKPVRIIQPVKKAQAMGKHLGFDHTDYPEPREQVKKAYLDLVYDFLQSGQELSPTMAGALAVIMQNAQKK